MFDWPDIFHLGELIRMCRGKLSMKLAISLEIDKCKYGSEDLVSGELFYSVEALKGIFDLLNCQKIYNLCLKHHPNIWM